MRVRLTFRYHDKDYEFLCEYSLYKGHLKCGRQRLIL